MRRLVHEDPAGRVDVLLARLAQRTAEHAGISGVYDNGLGEFVEEVISRTVPNHAFSVVEIADACGLLPARRPIGRPNKGAIRGIRK